MGVYTLFNSKIYNWVFYFCSIVILCGFSLAAIHMLYPELLTSKVEFYTQMFEVFFTGQESSDPSSNARIYATEIVIDYFYANSDALLFGFGKVSHQFNDGWESIFGYFYPSDIGLLGGFFLYGVVGLILLYIIPIYISIKVLRETSLIKNNFIITVRYVLISVLLLFQQHAGFFAIMTIVVPLFILKAYKSIHNEV
jgi:hypothetical protein